MTTCESISTVLPKESKPTSVFKQMAGKLSGDNITTIVLSFIAAGTVCFACCNGSSLEINSGTTSVKLNSSKRTV